MKLSEAKLLKIATGGWSCNETVISAMKENILFWSLHWELSKRGGYFEFSLPMDFSKNEQ